MCVRKFLGCFPPRIGCIVLAYAGIACSVLMIAWFTWYFRATEEAMAEALSVEHHSDEDQHNMADLVRCFSYLVYVVVGCNLFVHGLFIIFSILLAIGAHCNKRGLVKAYFVYGFFHFFFVLFLANLQFFAPSFVAENLATALVVIVDIIFAFCLCGVKGMMNSMNDKGLVYFQPALTEYKHLRY